MEKIKKIGIVLFLFCFIFGGIGCSSTTKKEESSDGIQFKEEYEKLNGKATGNENCLRRIIKGHGRLDVRYLSVQDKGTQTA